jgi:4-carboxymuconolactone decarboxylase
VNPLLDTDTVIEVLRGTWREFPVSLSTTGSLEPVWAPLQYSPLSDITEEPRMARLPLVNEDDSAEAAAVYQEIAGSRGRVLNVFRGLGHAPEGLRRLAALGEYVRFQTRLSDRLRELVILATARANGCQYEWTQHVPLALRSGVTEAEVDALNDGRVPDGLSPLEDAAVRYVQELGRDRRVADATFAALRAHLDEREITDLTLVTAYYTALGMALNAFEVDLQPGQEPLLRQ